MKITEIKRKVTGRNYDNIELTAQLQKGTDISEAIEKAVDLDKVAREMLAKIYNNEDREREDEDKKQNMLNKIESLKKAILKNQVDELPF